MSGRAVLWALPLFLACVPLAMAQPPRTNGGGDGRVRVDPNERGNEFLLPIGLLIDRNSRKTATGVLVSNCHVLTNRHAVGGIRKAETGASDEVVEDFGADVAGNVLEFHIGFDVLKPFKLHSMASATVIASGGGGDVDDWALLRLDGQFGNRYGAAALGDSALTPGELVIAAGYPADKLYVTDKIGRRAFDFWLWKQEGALQEYRSYWIADLKVLAGQSGSPVFVKGLHGYILVGLLRAELPPTPLEIRPLAQVVPLGHAIDRLTREQQRYPCN